MAFIKIRWVVLVILAAATISSHAQLKIKLVGKQYTIPQFVADTGSPPNYVKRFAYPEPILHSRYPLEIRFYAFFMPKMTTVFTLKGNKDTLMLEREEIGDYSLGKFEVKKLTRTNKVYYVLEYHSNEPQLADTLLRNLIRDGLFIQIDQHKLLKALKLKGVEINPLGNITDCCLDAYIEVKINGHYRSFTYNSDPASANQQIKELKQGGMIAGDFWYTYNRLRLVTDAQSND